MAHGDTEKTKIAECRLYTAGWGFMAVSGAAVLVALLSTAEGADGNAPFICATFIVMIGYPCVVLAAWGDAINKVIDSVFGIFKKKEKE